MSRLFSQKQDNIILGDRLTNDGRRILMDCGLQNKYADLFADYQTRIIKADTRLNADIEAARSIRHEVEKERPQIELELRSIARLETREFRTYVRFIWR
jgi:hypothetical protein